MACTNVPITIFRSVHTLLVNLVELDQHSAKLSKLTHSKSMESVPVGYAPPMQLLKNLNHFAWNNTCQSWSNIKLSHQMTRTQQTWLSNDGIETNAKPIIGRQAKLNANLIQLECRKKNRYTHPYGVKYGKKYSVHILHYLSQRERQKKKWRIALAEAKFSVCVLFLHLSWWFTVFPAAIYVPTNK